jgi:L-seryl-tRNA(Ser) seleniumtransferase
VISAAIAKFGVMARPREFNPEALGNVTPYYSWQIDRTKLNITGPEVMQQLAVTRPMGIGSMGANASGMRGRNPEEPRAASGAGGGARPTADVRKQEHDREHAKDPDSFGFAVWQLKDGEDKIIVDRLVEIYNSAKKA